MASSAGPQHFPETVLCKVQVSQLACYVLQEALNVKPNTTFVGCSDKVAAVLGPDVMKSVKPLIPDLLAALPVLLYQGESVRLSAFGPVCDISAGSKRHEERESNHS